jgi:hypothetical protein
MLPICRCADLPEHMKAMLMFIRMIMLIAGPNQPASFEAYLDALGLELQKLAKGVFLQVSNDLVCKYLPWIHAGSVLRHLSRS